MSFSVLDSRFVNLICRLHSKTMLRVLFSRIMEGVLRQDNRERLWIWWRYVHKKKDDIHKEFQNRSHLLQNLCKMKTNVLPTRKMDPRSPRVTRKRTRVIQLIVSSNVVKTTCVTLETTNKWSAGCCCCCMCYACKLCLYNIYSYFECLVSVGFIDT